MYIEKNFRELENIEEIHIYNVNKQDLINTDAPQVKQPEKIRFGNIMRHVPSDIDVFLPIDDGEDYIVERIGWNLLERTNTTLQQVEGRKLSQISPVYYDICKKAFKEVCETNKTKNMRLYYHISDKIHSIANVNILYDEGEVYCISDFKNTSEELKSEEEEILEDEENKANLIEYFSQTGSYYKSRGEFTWTPGIYNIINRSSEPQDRYYNIIFDLVLPEDKALVEELLDTMSPETDSYENIIRIKTPGGKIKYLDTYLYSKFDENGDEISHYGLFKDVSVDSHKHMTRPIDFMLNGFKHNSKLSLLIEPLSKRYEFSQGFYDIVEVSKQDYIHSREIINYIDEKDVREDIEKIIKGEICEINKVITFNVHGDENNQKICELFIERFNYGNKQHSIGFLTDVTCARKRQHELEKTSATKNILIKEVHHRVKNNLQVLNSFLNLERRAYRDDPNLILDNMQARLSSLALLHEKTYNTEDFVNINLKDYMEGQDESLKSLFNTKNINFTTEIDPEIHLSIEIITPLLLIVDELTMNAIKHAFPDENMENKTISKQIKFIDENICELTLKDNGIGLGNPEKLINHNLGWEIVNNLTRQLNGRIEILDTDVGTGFKLIFPKSFEYKI